MHFKLVSYSKHIANVFRVTQVFTRVFFWRPIFNDVVTTMQVDDLSEYEVERLANIQRNQELAEVSFVGLLLIGG